MQRLFCFVNRKDTHNLRAAGSMGDWKRPEHEVLTLDQHTASDSMLSQFSVSQSCFTAAPHVMSMDQHIADSDGCTVKLAYQARVWGTQGGWGLLHSGAETVPAAAQSSSVLAVLQVMNNTGVETHSFVYAGILALLLRLAALLAYRRLLSVNCSHGMNNMGFKLFTTVTATSHNTAMPFAKAWMGAEGDNIYCALMSLSLCVKTSLLTSTLPCT